MREALEFSALLRQPPNFSREQKLAYIDHVIQLLDMESYADAIVGVPGSGLNVEREFGYFFYMPCLEDGLVWQEMMPWGSTRQSCHTP